jgi:hypothetical protein
VGTRIPQYPRERFYQVEQVLLDKGVEIGKGELRWKIRDEAVSDLEAK